MGFELQQLLGLIDWIKENKHLKLENALKTPLPSHQVTSEIISCVMSKKKVSISIIIMFYIHF